MKKTFALLALAMVLAVSGCTNADGGSDVSSADELSPALSIATAPVAPTGLWATAISATRIDIGWTDNADNELGFKIKRRKGSGDWVRIAILPANSTTYSATGLKPGKNYTFKVIAYNADGKAVSNKAYASTYPLWPIASPGSIFASAASMTSISLSWSDGSNNEVGFKIERKTGYYGAWSQIAAVGENVTTFLSGGLAPSTTYYFRVRAYNSSGDSSYSPEGVAVTNADNTPPTAPAVTLTPFYSTRMDLAWTASTDNFLLAGYDVYRDDVRLGGTTAAVRSYSDGSVPSPAIDYCYVVKALDSSSNATPSAPACGFTPGLSGAFPVSSSPNAVMGLSAATDGVNFLAGILGDTVSDSSENALLINPRALRQAPILHLSGSGGMPSVAWSGNYYLAIWPDDGNTAGELKGQVISAAGDTVGGIFDIAAGVEARGLAGGGGKFLAVYTVEDSSAAGRGTLWGRFISENGTVDSPIALTGDTVKVDELAWPAASFDGYGFLVPFMPLKAADGFAPNAVAARFVSLAGALGAQVTLDTDGQASGYMAAGFSGGQHLVAWTDEVAAGNLDIYARTVTSVGGLGTTVAVSSAAGRQIFPGIAYNGTVFIVSFVDAANDLDGDDICDAGESTCWDLKAQWVTTSGTLSGGVTTISSEAGNQMGLPLWGAGRLFFLISNFGQAVGAAPANVTGRFYLP